MTTRSLICKNVETGNRIPVRIEIMNFKRQRLSLIYGPGTITHNNFLENGLRKLYIKKETKRACARNNIRVKSNAQACRQYLSATCGVQNYALRSCFFGSRQSFPDTAGRCGLPVLNKICILTSLRLYCLTAPSLSPLGEIFKIFILELLMKVVDLDMAARKDKICVKWLRSGTTRIPV